MGVITLCDGRQEWREDGKRHRLDGAARIWANGHQEWYVDGKLHRTDGPAVIWPDGSQRWFIRGNHITKQVTAWMQQRNVTWPWDESTQMEFALT